uniref:Interleukin 17d n=1 Tax=Oryzias sinensis TaxID=183150 RepID=A0A8C7XWH4_9TELE
MLSLLHSSSLFHHDATLAINQYINVMLGGFSSHWISFFFVEIYPRSIPEAYCLCKGCLIGPSGDESRQYRSTPVYSPSVILRRTGSCAGGRHSYSEIYVSIAVGCTCV